MRVFLVWFRYVRWVRDLTYVYWALQEIPKQSLTRSHHPTRKEKGEGIFFIRPGSRLVQQQGRTDVAEVMLERSWMERKIHRWFSTAPCWSTVATSLP